MINWADIAPVDMWDIKPRDLFGVENVIRIERDLILIQFGLIKVQDHVLNMGGIALVANESTVYKEAILAASIVKKTEDARDDLMYELWESFEDTKLKVIADMLTKFRFELHAYDVAYEVKLVTMTGIPTYINILNNLGTSKDPRRHWLDPDMVHVDDWSIFPYRDEHGVLLMEVDA